MEVLEVLEAVVFFGLLSILFLGLLKIILEPLQLAILQNKDSLLPAREPRWRLLADESHHVAIGLEREDKVFATLPTSLGRELVSAHRNLGLSQGLGFDKALDFGRTDFIFHHGHEGVQLVV